MYVFAVSFGPVPPIVHTPKMCSDALLGLGIYLHVCLLCFILGIVLFVALTAFLAAAAVSLSNFLLLQLFSIGKTYHYICIHEGFYLDHLCVIVGAG